jgi:hypothetical protein
MSVRNPLESPSVAVVEEFVYLNRVCRSLCSIYVRTEESVKQFCGLVFLSMCHSEAPVL